MKIINTILLLLLLPTASAFSQVVGTWKVAPQAGSLAFGPTRGDFSWWTNSIADLTAQACFFDDEYVFNSNGSFNNVFNGTTWVEMWQNQSVMDQCNSPVPPHAGNVPATWALDSVNGTLTLDGLGAYLGLSRVVNGAELTHPSLAPQSITYLVEINADTMNLDIDIGGGFYRFVLVRNVPASVAQSSESLLSFYPNPATSKIHVEPSVQVEKFSIRSITGKEMLARQDLFSNEVFDISAFPSGIYFVEYRANGQKATQKLVVD